MNSGINDFGEMKMRHHSSGLKAQGYFRGLNSYLFCSRLEEPMSTIPVFTTRCESGKMFVPGTELS
jgi:hypothetical protein